MCGPTLQAALIMAGTTAASAGYQASQNRKAERRARMEREEARKSEAAQLNAQKGNQLNEASPLLIKSAGQSANRGLDKLKVSGRTPSGYSSLGMGGNSNTGLNIA
tara:strand:- start:106 stop:423 length:318 start_codon:yes stop_codon:yes gene_type:complete